MLFEGNTFVETLSRYICHFCLQDNLVSTLLLHCIDRLLNQLPAQSQSPVLWVNCKHCNVTSLFLGALIRFIVFIKFGHDAPNLFAFVESKEGELGPLLNKVPVGVDGVGLRQLFLDQTHDVFEVFFCLECLEFYFGGVQVRGGSRRGNFIHY